MQQELLDTVTDLVTPLLTGARVIVGIVGPPGAGKSTLAEGVAARFDRLRGSVAHVPGAYQHRTAMCVPMDGFHLSNMELGRLGLADRKGAPETFDGWGFVHLLRRIHAAEELVYAPVFNRVLNESIGSAVPIFPSVELVVVEGNYLLLPEDPWVRARPLYDLAIYLNVPDEVRVPRLVRRQRARGLDAAAALEWVQRSDEANARLVATTRAHADVVLPHD
jgi:pantothenate kinase